MTGLGRRLHYLSIFDPGNAEIRWPQKDPASAQRSRGMFGEELKSVIRHNLLWRPHTLFKDSEPFDNLTLAHFLQTRDARMLAESGLLNVFVEGKTGRFCDLFFEWARKPGQHFHHLSPGQHAAYAEREASGRMQSLDDFQEALNLDDYDLGLGDLIDTCTTLFPEKQQISTTARVSPSWFAERALKLWSRYRDTLQNYRASGRELQTLEHELIVAARNGARRRHIYSRFEEIETAWPGDRRLHDLIKDVKVFVVNAAFLDQYDRHFVQSPHPRRIAAVRDLRPRWRSGLDIAGEVTGHPSALEPLGSFDLGPLHRLTMEHLVAFHTEGRYGPFQNTVRALDRLPLRADSDVVTPIVKQHLVNLRECAKEALGTSAVKGAIADVYGFRSVEPYLPLVVKTGCKLVGLDLSLPVDFVLQFGLLLITRKAFSASTLTDEYRQAEKTLEGDIIEALIGDDAEEK